MQFFIDLAKRLIREILDAFERFADEISAVFSLSTLVKIVTGRPTEPVVQVVDALGNLASSLALAPSAALLLVVVERIPTFPELHRYVLPLDQLVSWYLTTTAAAALEILRGGVPPSVYTGNAIRSKIGKLRLWDNLKRGVLRPIARSFVIGRLIAAVITAIDIFVKSLGVVFLLNVFWYVIAKINSDPDFVPRLQQNNPRVYVKETCRKRQ